MITWKLSHLKDFTAWYLTYSVFMIYVEGVGSTEFFLAFCIIYVPSVTSSLDLVTRKTIIYMMHQFVVWIFYQMCFLSKKCELLPIKGIYYLSITSSWCHHCNMYHGDMIQFSTIHSTIKGLINNFNSVLCRLV